MTKEDPSKYLYEIIHKLLGSQPVLQPRNNSIITVRNCHLLSQTTSQFSPDCLFEKAVDLLGRSLSPTPLQFSTAPASPIKTDFLNGICQTSSTSWLGSSGPSAISTRVVKKTISAIALRTAVLNLESGDPWGSMKLFQGVYEPLPSHPFSPLT